MMIAISIMIVNLVIWTKLIIAISDCYEEIRSIKEEPLLY
jgi:hypothetical protein